MKKNILSLFILSTTLFSTQSNAIEYIEKNVGTITINGSVTPIPRCQLDEIQPIELPPVQANNFGDDHIANTPAQPFRFNLLTVPKTLIVYNYKYLNKLNEF